MGHKSLNQTLLRYDSYSPRFFVRWSPPNTQLNQFVVAWVTLLRCVGNKLGNFRDVEVLKSRAFSGNPHHLGDTQSLVCPGECVVCCIFFQMETFPSLPIPSTKRRLRCQNASNLDILIRMIRQPWKVWDGFFKGKGGVKTVVVSMGMGKNGVFLGGTSYVCDFCLAVFLVGLVCFGSTFLMQKSHPEKPIA